MKRNAWYLICWLTFAGSSVEAQNNSVGVVPEESSVTYRLSHPLHKIEATSKDVRYSLDVDVHTRQIKHVSAQVDVMTFDSGNSNRDSHAMEVIDAISYPEAEFMSTSVVQNGDSIQVTGTLTFHGVTETVVMPGTTTWSEHKVVVQGSFDVSLTTFKIDRPSLLMIPVDDTLSFSIVAVFGW